MSWIRWLLLEGKVTCGHFGWVLLKGKTSGWRFDWVLLQKKTSCERFDWVLLEGNIVVIAVDGWVSSFRLRFLEYQSRTIQSSLQECPPLLPSIAVIVEYWIRERHYCWVLYPFHLFLLDLTGWCLKFVDYWWKGRRCAGVDYTVTNNAAAVREDVRRVFWLSIAAREDVARAFRLSIAAREDAGRLGRWVYCNAGRGWRCCWKMFCLCCCWKDTECYLEGSRHCCWWLSML